MVINRLLTFLFSSFTTTPKGLLLTLLWASSFPVLADQVSATLDKNVSVENEVVQLTLRADFTDIGDGPDLTPLKRDFDILGQSQNSQFSFNLGTSKALSFWVVSLMPKSVGTFEIPPIQIGDQSSNSVRLTVKNSPQLLDSNGNPPAFIRTEVSEIEPYLQQEVILSVKLFSSVALQNANISVPSHPDLIIERLVDDQMHTETINGTQYQVLTREYLAFPQRSGTLTLAPQSIQAMINTRTGRRMIKVQSEPLGMQVLPIPASYPSDNWLPSENLIINTSLSQSNDQPRIGDTLIWTINIQADGALPEQIPPLSFNSTKAYKLYPKAPRFSSRKTDQGIVGLVSMEIEVVPTAEGELNLPELEVMYWDTEQRTLKTATATTQSINIQALPEAITEAPKTQLSTTPLAPQSRSVAPISLAKEKQASVPVDIKDAKVEPLKERSQWGLKQYSIVGLLVLTSLLILLSLFTWRRNKNKKDNQDSVPTLQEFAPLATHNEESAFQNLIDCCHQNNLPELRSHLLEWARHRWGDAQIQTIEDIKRLSSSVTFTQLLMEADLMMYSNNQDTQWQGAPLAQALTELMTGEEKPSQASQLKTLYPNF
ncbi:BatD family protein [Marinomonas epiphytica]